MESIHTRHLVTERASGPNGCQVGACVADITPAYEVAMAGYSSDGERGRPDEERLFARAIYFEDAEGDRIAWCALDLWAGSTYLLVGLANELEDLGLGIDRIVLSGTHTHSAPGNHAGNGFYDTFAQCDAGFRGDVASLLLEQIAVAIRAASQRKRPAAIAVAETSLWGISRNRSLEPFTANFVAPRRASRVRAEAKPSEVLANASSFHGSSAQAVEAWLALRSPTEPPPAGLSLEQRAIDPRLRVFTAVDDTRRVIATLGVFSCHATALGRRQEIFSRDWPGHAVDAVERALGGRAVRGRPVAAFVQGAAADVSPLPPDDGAGGWEGPVPDEGGDTPADYQGRALAQFVGETVGDAWARLAREARTTAEPFEVGAALYVWEPLADAPEGAARGGSSARTWSIGWPVVAGAEDSRTWLHRVGLAFEGMRSDYFLEPDRDLNQYPKNPFLGFLQRTAKNVFDTLRPSTWHPMHIVRLGGHVIATLPFEPTTVAAFRVEQALQQEAESHGGTSPESVTVVGYSSDYAGYLTTRPEYELQHYEGAHTLYGADSCERVVLGLRQAMQRDTHLAVGALPEELSVRPVSAEMAGRAWAESASAPKAELLRPSGGGERAVVAVVTPAGQRPRVELPGGGAESEQPGGAIEQERTLSAKLAGKGGSIVLLPAELPGKDAMVKVRVGDRVVTARGSSLA